MNKLTQLLIANKGGSRLDIQAKSNEATVYLYGPIVDTDADAEWWGGVSAETFAKAIHGLKAEVIHLRINSPGGSVFGGRAMETALRNHSAKVIAYVDGVAASAASFVAMGADEIEMAPGSFLMIHKAWSLCIGNANDMIKSAELLEQIDGTLVDTYAAKTGIDKETIAAMLADETWLEANDAIEKGFANRLQESAKAKNQWDLSAYAKAPQIERLPEPEPPPAIDRAHLARAAMARIKAI